MNKRRNFFKLLTIIPILTIFKNKKTNKQNSIKIHNGWILDSKDLL